MIRLEVVHRHGGTFHDGFWWSNIGAKLLGSIGSSSARHASRVAVAGQCEPLYSAARRALHLRFTKTSATKLKYSVQEGLTDVTDLELPNFCNFVLLELRNMADEDDNSR